MVVRMVSPGRKPFFITAKSGDEWGSMALIMGEEFKRWSEDYGSRYGTKDEALAIIATITNPPTELIVGEIL